MEKRTIRTGAPLVLAGAGVLASSLVFGLGGVLTYVIAAGVGVAAFAAGKKLFPDRVVEVERAPQSGNAEVDALIREARAQLDELRGMLASLRTFLRYYLPATLKLLTARAKIEGEVSGGQSAQIAGRIREAMRAVQTAFHKQLDALNEYRFINLESEMDVLADMLKSDGLTDDAPVPAAQDTKEEEEDDPFAGLFTQGGK